MRRDLSLLLLIAFGLTCLDAQLTKGRDEPVRALIKSFANARNLHNGPSVAALYADDGEWISESGAHTRGRAALAELWSNADGHVDRTISSVDFPGPDIAVVRVITQYKEPIGKHSEVFILVKEKVDWKIRVHQTVR